jgi:asparagine synthase (glutamine-hydrolysing)
MCGFAAIYNFSGRPIDPADLARMTHSLVHRGPDDYAFAFCGTEQKLNWREQAPPPIQDHGVAMGHRRLKILDLSDAGRQPFVSTDGRYWMVYNGEVFNYIELRSELQTLGYEFHTKTDTEVVLNAFIQWGTDCFNRFNGMWGLVIWDAHERRLVASRDRFGIKPIYYHRVEGGILFASEIKAILQHPSATRRPDTASVVAYLARRAAPTGGATFYADISTVKPGCWISIDWSGNMDEGRYWTLPEQYPCKDSFEEASEQLRELLADAVKLRLRSDVRVGTMLSGGLDSTSVIALVAERMGMDSSALAATGESLHSFTATFPG